MIFTLTSLPASRPIDDKRTWGYYLTREEALKAVESNRGNMEEGFYSYLVLEQYRPGVIALAEGELWFEWKDQRWQSCARPAWADGITNWAMG